MIDMHLISWMRTSMERYKRTKWQGELPVVR